MKINGKHITDDEVLEIVRQWYTDGMYPDILQDEDGNDLEEIIEELQNPEPDDNYEPLRFDMQPKKYRP